MAEDKLLLEKVSSGVPLIICFYVFHKLGHIIHLTMSSKKSLILNILKQAWELYEAGKLEEMVDPAAGSYPQEEAIRYLKVALFCTQAAASRRPSMLQVVKMLSKPIRINESELTAPGYINEYKNSDSKATASTSSRLKNSTVDSDMFSTVVPQTVTEVSPR
jgi:hypothetical protein